MNRAEKADLETDEDNDTIGCVSTIIGIIIVVGTFLLCNYFFDDF